MTATITRPTLRDDLAQISLEFINGDSLQAIASRRGVTREAVRQLLSGVQNYAELKERHDASVHARSRRTADVRDYEARRAARRLHGLSHGRRVHRRPDDELVAQVAAWAARHGEPVTISRWNAIADPEFVAIATITKRLGWNAAKERAGLGVNAPPAHIDYSFGYTDVEIMQWVVRWLHTLDDVADASYAGYEQWSRFTAPEAPSGATVRDRSADGVWATALRAALALYHADDAVVRADLP